MAKLVHDIQKKQHRERSQVASRARLGFLEKHKDYVKRARNFHQKEATLKILREKAKARNPDEFYYGMNSRRVDEDGLMTVARIGPNSMGSLSVDQVKLLKTQDSNYIRTLTQAEAKKLERSKKELTFTAQGKHTVFVDSVEERDHFSPENFFKTTTDMLNRRENRLTRDQLAGNDLARPTIRPASAVMQKSKLAKQKLQQLKLAKQHLVRQRQLAQVQQRMDMQREVMKNGSKKKVVDSNGNVYFKWKKQRKR